MLHTSLRYIEKGKDKALAQCREKLAELQALYKKKGGQKKEVEEQKQALQKELANAKVSNCNTLVVLYKVGGACVTTPPTGAGA